MLVAQNRAWLSQTGAWVTRRLPQASWLLLGLAYAPRREKREATSSRVTLVSTMVTAQRAGAETADPCTVLRRSLLGASYENTYRDSATATKPSGGSTQVSVGQVCVVAAYARNVRHLARLENREKMITRPTVPDANGAVGLTSGCERKCFGIYNQLQGPLVNGAVLQLSFSSSAPAPQLVVSSSG